MLDLLADRLAKLTGRLQGLIPAQHDLDAGCIHDLRVVSRRLRSVLQLFSPLLAKKRNGRLRRELRQVTRALGAVREFDVALEQVDRLRSSGRDPAELAGLEHVRVGLLTEDARARVKAERAVGRLKLERLVAGLERLCRRLHAHQPETDWTAEVLPPLERRAHEALDGLAELQANEDMQRLHAARLAFKKLRYHLENLQECGVSAAGELIEPLKRGQEMLGLYHDMSLLIEMLRDAAAGLSDVGCDTLARGCFAAVERAQLEQQAAYGAFTRLLLPIGADELVLRVKRDLSPEPPQPQLVQGLTGAAAH